MCSVVEINTTIKCDCSNRSQVDNKKFGNCAAFLDEVLFVEL